MPHHTRNATLAPNARNDWLTPVSLIMLSIVPALAGLARLYQLGAGEEVTLENARFVEAPIPIIIHVVASIHFSIVGAFQFSSAVRRRAPRLHRSSGRLLVVSGMAVALSGLWMTHFYELPPQDGELLYVIRMLVGFAMAGCLIAGLSAILNGDVFGHRAFMMRAYALGLGAGTQVVLFAPLLLTVGMPDVWVRGVLMGAGWALNLLFAEGVIRRRAAVQRLIG